MKRMISFLFLLTLSCSGAMAMQQAAEETPASPEVPAQIQLTPDHSIEELELLVAPLTLDQLKAEADNASTTFLYISYEDNDLIAKHQSQVRDSDEDAL